MLIDLHTHSCFSFDGATTASPDAMCQAAIQKGIAVLAITDHCDVSGELDGTYPKYNRSNACAAVLAAKERYRGQLHVLYGIELGEATQAPAYAKELLETHPFDFVLASLHNLAGVPDFYYMNFSREDFPSALMDQLFERYLAELTELCRFPGIHSLAHITYPLRYFAESGKTFDLTRFEEPLRYLFEVMIANNVALEMNTSTLFGTLKETMPPQALLRLYRECGGKLITVGSDAHSPERIGNGISVAYQMLLNNGFDHVTVFQGGTPELYSI